MNEWADTIKAIKELQKDRNEKLNDIQKYKDKVIELNKKVDECDMKISWLKEDMEDIVCNYFSEAKRVYVNNKDEYVEIEFFVGSELNLLKIEEFVKMINKTLYECKIWCDADASMYLKIML